jgi:hypothetical protein
LRVALGNGPVFSVDVLGHDAKGVEQRKQVVAGDAAAELQR